MPVRVTLLAALALLTLPALAVAAEGVPSPQPHQALPAFQFYAALIGALAPLVGYVLNYVGPQIGEKVKALVQVVVAGAAGALYQLLEVGDLGLDTETLQVVGTAVVAALLAHHGLYKPSTISTAFGGGRNKGDAG